jgi:hypothetical protein
MKGYYDFMSQEKFTVNAPNNWAKAIRMIDAADKQIDPAQEPAAKLRIDDVKQYWYFYYLLESGQATPASEAFKELIWKGQMSYMNAMQMLTRRFFQKGRAAEIAGEKYASGPAHFTHEETQEWWTKILGHWQVTPVDNFSDAILADGTKGADVDMNDLVQVSNFQGPEYVVQPFSYHSNFQNTVDFLTAASKPGVEIGFKLWWGSDPNRRGFRDKDVSYGISVWNGETKEWDELVDSGTTYSHSKTAQFPNGLAYELVNVQYKAPKAGTYRVEIGRGGQSAKLAPVHFDPVTDTSSEVRAHTYFSSLAGKTQSPTYIYIPKGTKSLDLEMWEKGGGKTVVLHNELPSNGLVRTRTVDVSAVGTHRIPLEPGEDGSIARLDANGFGFPYLYSVPMLWAKSPAELLVPRAVAKADGLTIAQDSNP